MTDWRCDRMVIADQGGLLAHLRFGLRLVAMGGVGAIGLGILLVLRVGERALHGAHRPWSPFVTQGVCRTVLRIMGLRVRITGRPLRAPGATVANHVSWLDILVLNASDRVYFVAKAEVAGWVAIGWLARATGTLFITRNPTQARIQQQEFEQRLTQGHRLLFFPEGTSSDGFRVLPFKSTLFAAFHHPELADRQMIQPVTVVYHAPHGQDARFYGWWGDMAFATSFRDVLRQSPQGWAEVTYHPPLAVADYPNRKAMAAACEAAVRQAHPSDRLR